MIEVSRGLLKHYRAVMRRSLLESDRRGPMPLVICRAELKTLSLEAFQGDIALRHRQEASFSPEIIPIPGNLLADLEGRGTVKLEVVSSSQGKASWMDGAVPRTVEFDIAAKSELPSLPEMPKDARELPSEFLIALTEATRSTAKESVRYGLSRLQLRGKSGEVVATDGKQLLVQGGFEFPWQHDILIPRLSVFGHRDMPIQGPVRIGSAKDVVVLETGPWTFWLKIDKEGRFPKIEQVMPKEAAIQTRLLLHPEDAQFLVTSLPKLPEPDQETMSVTLDLCKPPAVRAKGEGDASLTEVVLARSSVSGKQVRINLDRRLLYRALKLGFSEIRVASPDVPVTCRDASRVFVFMPLNPEGVFDSAKDAVRIVSAEADNVPPHVSPERRNPPMPASQTHGNGEDNGRSETPANGFMDLIAEAETIRDMLQQASSRSARLVSALKQQRRQTRAMQQAMASLRQLNFDR